MNKTINLGQLGSDQVEAFHANLNFSIPHLVHNPFRDIADVFFVILNRFELTVHHQWSLIGKMWRSSCDVPPNFSDPNTAFGSNFWGHVIYDSPPLVVPLRQLVLMVRSAAHVKLGSGNDNPMHRAV